MKESGSSASNEDNKGKILEISNGSIFNSDNITNYQVGVKGHKTVIVKGGNIYINADIYNENDSNSILVLVAKRDDSGGSENNKNGGNIYINPSVTNIDAVIIADGSIINYDGTKKEVVEFQNDLRNQLFIYGSTFTKNSIGSLKSPYGSDGYIENPNDLSIGAHKYDLTKLRYFSRIPSQITGEGVTWTNCLSNNGNTYFVPRAENNSMKPKEYAWAGKRQCYNQTTPDMVDDVATNLRGTEKYNPLIIEYNSIIKTNPPRILKDNSF